MREICVKFVRPNPRTPGKVVKQYGGGFNKMPKPKSYTDTDTDTFTSSVGLL